MVAVLSALMVLGTMCVSAFAADGDYYVTGSQNGDLSGDWEVYEPFSAKWQVNGDAMKDTGNGIYTFTAEFPASDYAIKVTDGTWDNAFGGYASGQETDNYCFTIDAAGSYTIKFDSSTGAIEVLASSLEVDDSSDSTTGSSTTAIIFAAIASLAVVATVSVKKYAFR